jgi:hypothetical protein
MSENLNQYLAADHERLDRLLQQATAVPGSIDRISYDAFRGGLLRHIAMEERTLFPAILRMVGEKNARMLDRLRLDHSALAALLVPPADAGIIATIRSILAVHNALEESQQGVYHLLDRLPEGETARLVEKLKVTTQVPAAPHNGRPGVLVATRRALARAGYHLQSG